MKETLLIIHILAGAAWIGAGFMNGFANPRMVKAGADAGLGWARTVSESIYKLFVPAIALTGLSGIGLVLVDDAWDWSDPFVGIGLVIVIVGLAMGLFGFKPTVEKIITARLSGDMPTAAAQGKKALRLGVTTSLMLILAVVVMVLRLGA